MGLEEKIRAKKASCHQTIKKLKTRYCHIALDLTWQTERHPSEGDSEREMRETKQLNMCDPSDPPVQIARVVSI